MEALGERFEKLVDRSGEHHVWLGFVAGDGTPQVRVGAKLTTARRVAWELAHGPIPGRQRVTACEAERRCVRVEHLQLGNRPALAPVETQPAERLRARGGSGSLRELRPGYWALTVSTPDGRRYGTATGSREDAEKSLRSLRVSVDGLTVASVADVVERYLAELSERGRADSTVRRYRQLWVDWLSPDLGELPAERVTKSRLERVLRVMARSGQSPSSVHQAAVVLSGAFHHAHTTGFVKTNPMIGLTLPTGAAMQRPRQRR